MREADIVRIVLGLLGPVSGVVAVILVLAVVLLGIYIRRYLEQKALHLATREDFQDLQKQVADSTRLVESIKSELANEDFVRRELHDLRVRKIEELVTLALNCEEDVDAHRNSALAGKHYDKAKHHNRMVTVATVYLPELEPMAKDYRAALLNHYQQMGRTALEAMNCGNHNVWDNFMENSNYKEVIATRSTLTTEASKLLQEIANGTVFRQLQGKLTDT